MQLKKEDAAFEIKENLFVSDMIFNKNDIRYCEF